MLGRILISLISMTFWFLRASAAFFWLAYFSLPRSRILQTGGSALGEISTRSRPASSAASNASLMETFPRFWPSASMSWTRGTLMSRFERGPSLVGAAALNGLRMVNSPWLLAIRLCRKANPEAYVVVAKLASIAQREQIITRRKADFTLVRPDRSTGLRCVL